MSRPLPPEARSSAYQRWEMASFDGARSGSGSPVLLPSAADIERMHEQAREEGYREGRDAAAQEAARLRQLAAGLEQQILGFEQRLAGDLLGLSLTIAKQVLRQALKVRPELILAAVNEAIGKLPQSSQRVHLILNPEDAALVRTHVGEHLGLTAWNIVEDGQLERGGCRIETAECEIDATLAGRWERVVASIGSDHAWLE